MILRIALRSLSAHPIRSLVLACGFGLGVGVMATLLGVGEVILDQARSPAVVGGGDVVITSVTGQVASARWILSSALRPSTLREPQGRPKSSRATTRSGRRIVAASPSRRATLYLVRKGATLPIRVRAGIPSLERAIGDPETASIDSWVDEDSDRAWSSPDPGDALRALDRFHPIPDVPNRAESWAEWLYFNGRAGGNRFYLTFLVGPRRGAGKRAAIVRLQLDRAGQRSDYSETQLVDEAQILRDAPSLTIGSSRVRLEGLRYEIALNLQGVTGTLFIDATPARALPPLTIRGAGGWLSGYVVPVMSGALAGTLQVDGQAVSFDGGAGYHDHNWGFWKDVSWRWGQVQHDDLSLVYGRIYPPADAADADRIPGFLAVLGPEGPVGSASNISIEETNDPATGRPRRIVVTGRSSSLDLTMELAIEDTVVTNTGGTGGTGGTGSTGGTGGVLFGAGLDFLQMRATYRVRGTVGGRAIDFTTVGSAETFRGQ